MYFVYFLESKKDSSKHYIGYSSNLKQRLSRHNSGLVRFTKKNRPWKIIYFEGYLNKQDAIGREKFLKGGSGWKFLKKQLKHYFSQ